ncbi:protein LLP homolog [Lytechinus variegatus]|uniref:protein LLP homolog n=1 Tax=Lytechinus variegatus TaxID=7654 RepID=UPI001BB2CDD6|nr:protein LLP homolog [Lytechinus variegatus]XP_041460324.1 protein LLP homolog [Lytechinus variegatus]
MAKSLRSKSKRKLKAVKRKRNAPKELIRLKKCLKLDGYDKEDPSKKRYQFDDIRELITKPDVNQATGKDYDVRFLPGSDVKMDTEGKKKRRKRRGEESDEEDADEEMVDASRDEDKTEVMSVDTKWNMKKLQNEHGNYPAWMNSRQIKKMQNKNSKGKVLKKGKKKLAW